MKLTKNEKFFLKLIFFLIVIVFFVFRLLPIIYTIWRSFIKINDGQYQFNAFNSYLFVLSQEVFWKSIGNSVLISMIYLIIKLTLIVIFGELLNSSRKLSNIVSKIAYLPSIIGGFVYAILFRYLLDSEGILSFFYSNNSLLSSPQSTQVIFAIILLWTSFGISLLMYLNRRKHMPIELLNVSQLEGANSFQRFRFVVFPYVKSSLIIISLLGIIEVFTEIELPMNLTFGGPSQSTITFGYLNYQSALLFGNFGNASASTVIFLIALLGISLFTKKIYEAFKKID